MPACADIVLVVPERPVGLAVCLDALQAGLPAGGRFVVVDDGCADPAARDLLRGLEGSARLIRNTAPRGPAAARNQGVMEASADVVVVLDAGVEVGEGWLAPLLESLDDPGVGAAAPRILAPDGRAVHAGVALGEGAVPAPLHPGAPGGHPAVARTRDVPMLTGSCLALRRAAVVEAGGFDVRFAVRHDDLDLCLRLARAGLAARQAGDAHAVLHVPAPPDDPRSAADGALFRRVWRGRPADRDRLLAEDGVADASWADCRWTGPLFGDGEEDALGRAALASLAGSGRRPLASESPRGPLAPGAAAACGPQVLAALNRLAVRVPEAPVFRHVAPGVPYDPPRASGVAVAVTGPGSGAAGVAAADAVIAAGPAALAAVRAAGVPLRRVATVDPAAPDMEGAARAVGVGRPGRPGIGWWGPLRGRSGYAAAGRGLLEGAALAGVPVRAAPADVPAPGMPPLPLPLPPQDFEPGAWVLHHPPALASGGDVWGDMAVALAAPVVGATCFEAAGVPENWVESARAAREVWVPTGFNARTFAASGMDPERIHVVPYPVDGAMLDGPPPRRRVPGEPVTFLSVFEWTWRKGWDVLLRAWAGEFAAGDPVRLVILTYRGAGAAREADIGEQAIGLLAGIGADPAGIADVELRLDPVPHGGMPDLYRSADALVLPTRGEGAGMPVFEAAACGLPVIATAFGGHEELMAEETAHPVAVEGLVPAHEDLIADNPMYEGMLLAEPSVESLRERLRAVAEDPEDAARRAAAAQELVRERFSPAAAGRALSERVAELTGVEVEVPGRVSAVRFK